MSLLGPEGFREVGDLIVARARYAARHAGRGARRVASSGRTATFKEFVVNFDGTGRTVAEINDALRARGIFGGWTFRARASASASRALYCVTEIHTAADIRRLAATLKEVLSMTGCVNFHAARWERAGGDGDGPPRHPRADLSRRPSRRRARPSGDAALPASMRRRDRPSCPRSPSSRRSATTCTSAR